MTEKEIKIHFARQLIPIFGSLINKNLRLYSLEFPVRTNDGVKYADMIVEVDEHKTPMNNKMFVLEFKKNKVDYGTVEQVLRYGIFIQKQLYRKKKVTSFIVGPEFSNWEIKMCKDNKVFPLQLDENDNMRLL